MRCSIAQSITWICKAAGRRSCHGIGYPFARSALYETFAVPAAAYPPDVILVSHILSIQWCAVRVRRRVLPIRRSGLTMPWNTPDVDRAVMCVARKGFYSFLFPSTDIVMPFSSNSCIAPERSKKSGGKDATIPSSSSFEINLTVISIIIYTLLIPYCLCLLR